VAFPDLIGCNTCGKDMEEAVEMARDALTNHLELSEPVFINPPTVFAAFYDQYKEFTALYKQYVVVEDTFIIPISTL